MSDCLYSEGMGLSCSLAFNGSTVFLFANSVCYKENTFALSSLTLEPYLVGSHPHSHKKNGLDYISDRLYSEGMANSLFE